MELVNIAVSFLIIIGGSLIIKTSEKHINRLRDSFFLKSFFKHSRYSEALFWYFSYFIKLSAYIFIGLVAISVLGFSSQVLSLFAFIMALAIIGVIAYSLRDVIPSLIAGAYILNSKVIKRGDTINFEGIRGKVIDISLMAVTVKDKKGVVALIPNKLLMNKIFKKR